MQNAQKYSKESSAAKTSTDLEQDDALLVLGVTPASEETPDDRRRRHLVYTGERAGKKRVGNSLGFMTYYPIVVAVIVVVIRECDSKHGHGVAVMCLISRPIVRAVDCACCGVSCGWDVVAVAVADATAVAPIVLVVAAAVVVVRACGWLLCSWVLLFGDYGC